jgi:hypothetical protein
MADEGLSAFAHDLPVIGLLDDDPAAGFRALVPLAAQLLDIGEAGHAGLGRLSRSRADALESLGGLLALRLLSRLSLGGLDALLACGSRLRLSLRGLDALLALRLHRLPLRRLPLRRLSRRRLKPLLAGWHLLALLGLLTLLGLLALRLHGLALGWLDALLVLYRRLAWLRLPRRGLLNHRPLRPFPVLGLHLLVGLRLGRHRLRLLPWWRRGRRRLLRLRLLPLRRRRRRLLGLRLRPWLRRLLLWRRLRSRLLLLRRLLGAGMLRVLTASGRRVLGEDDRPRGGRGWDAFGRQEPLRHSQRGYGRDRQHGILSRRFHLQNPRQVPLLALRRHSSGRAR